MPHRSLASGLVAFALVSTALPVLAAGHRQKSSSWWGDPAVPAPNHVEMTMEGIQPDLTVSGNISFVLTCTVSSQGVRQVCPEEVLTSAPGGSDSNRNASDGGAELRKFRLGMVAEQAATVKPHATMAMTRLMIGPHH